MTNNESLVTEGEAASLLRVSLTSVRRWRREGRGPVYRKLGRSVRYRRDDLAARDRRDWAATIAQLGRPSLICFVALFV